MNGFEFLLCIGALIFAGMLYSCIRGRVQFSSLPTLEQYFDRHPHCRTRRGVKCVRCHSSSIRNWGLYDAQSTERVFICNHCGTRLYRR